MQVKILNRGTSSAEKEYTINYPEGARKVTIRRNGYDIVVEGFNRFKPEDLIKAFTEWTLGT